MLLSMRITTSLLLAILFGVLPCAGVLGEEKTAISGDSRVAVLRTAIGSSSRDAPGSMWRYFETWQTDIALQDGKLIHVDLFKNRKKGPDGKWVINEAQKVNGSAFPPDNWRKTDFDDSDWIRHPGPFYASPYRRLALLCLRGRFEVTDPDKVGDLTLNLKFQGGAVAYVNGTEVGRAFMPKGPIKNTTVAQEYPQETYLTAKGKMLTEFPAKSLRAKLLSTTMGKLRLPWGWDEDKTNRFKKRGRIVEFKIPSSQLQRGVNVLSVEIHRAPAAPLFFLNQVLKLETGRAFGDGRCWNRASIEEVTLSASAPASGIVPNIRHPKGARLWAEGRMAPMSNRRRFGDPNERVSPIRVVGMRNGVYAGLAVVSSRSAIRGLKASVSDLKLGPSLIPAKAIRLAYPGVGWQQDALHAEPPSEIAAPSSKESADNACQPISVIVNVPRDAAPGLYSGRLSVNVEGEKPMTLPVELNVAGNWVVPEPRDFITFVGIHQSPDSVAIQYKEPLWSEKHWEHLDKIYQLLGQIGTKDIYLPILAKTHLANEQSMVRWIKQAGGGYKYDFKILERYLDMALKHLGKVPVVCLYLHDYGFRVKDRQVPNCVTQVDPATGKLSDLSPPQWGTPEAEAFWKPVIDRLLKILSQRGVEKKSLLFGMAANNWVHQKCLEDLKRWYPEILWANRTHYYAPKAGKGKIRQSFGLVANVSSTVAVSYNPEEWEKHCGWRSKRSIINFPREFVKLSSYPAAYRLFAEGTLLSSTMGWRGGPASCGLGHIGADFWRVKKGKRGRFHNLANRYCFWHSLSIGTVDACILAPSPGGPVDTVRYQLMREALQEAEASVFVREALLDATLRAKLGEKLETRCRALCLERTWELWHYTHFAGYGSVFNEARWNDYSEALYTAAGDVAKALGK